MPKYNFYKKTGTIKKLALIVIISASTTIIFYSIINYFFNKDYILNVAANKISLGEFNEILASKKYVLSKLHNDENIISESYNEKEIIEDLKKSLIQDEVIYQLSASENIKVSEKEIINELNSFKDMIDSDKQYSDYLNSNSTSIDTIKKHIEKDLVSKKYIDKLLRKTTVSDAEVNQYYKENKNSLFTFDEIRVSHILLKTTDSNTNDLSNDIKSNIQTKMNYILNKIKSGEDFNKLAKKFSDDEGSSNVGGDLGYFSSGVMDEKFEQVAFSTEVGSVSDVFETPFGYHILKVTDKRTKTLDLKESYILISELAKINKVKNHINELIKAYPVDIYR